MGIVFLFPRVDLPATAAAGRSFHLILAGSLFALLTTDRLSSKGNRIVETETRFPETRFRFHNVKINCRGNGCTFPQNAFLFP